MSKIKHWYKPKPYPHLSRKLVKQDFGFVMGYVSNENSVAKHGFYPLIHMVKAQRKYKTVKLENGQVKRRHSYKEGKVTKSTKKYRDIYYATHMDSHIYSYYSNKILGKLYEKELSKTPELSNCISAYRRIPVENSDRNKCNIHFAKDVFDYIKIKGECVAMTFDITSFFDSLDHEMLKKCWCRILNENKLPKDHYNIFKSLTQFSYVDLGNPRYKKKGLLKAINIEHVNDLRRKKIDSFFGSPKMFRSKVVASGLIKRNTDKNGMLKKFGIPQGTPLSAFLANLFLLEFDKKMYDVIQVKFNGLYRRYSDDIAVICDFQNKDEIENLVHEEIKNFNLDIQKEKTKTWVFNLNLDNLLESYQIDSIGLCSKKAFQYLGFEFDGSRVLLKSTSLAKFYRNMKQVVRRRAVRARHYINKRPSLARIYRKNVYKRFTHLGMNCRKKNYIKYGQIAYKIFDERSIKKQVSKSWNKVQKEIERFAIKNNLNK